MLLSVFTRHSAGCKFSRDCACRRCNCPKWVGGQINGYYFRQSAKTRRWVAQAVDAYLADAYLADAVSRSVEASTLKKLETIFRSSPGREFRAASVWTSSISMRF